MPVLALQSYSGHVVMKMANRVSGPVGIVTQIAIASQRSHQSINPFIVNVVTEFERAKLGSCTA